jgi:hypothetical protein
MSFPLNPVNGSKAVVNGIKYVYSSVTNSWRRDFNNVLDRLFLVGGNQAINTSTGDLVVTGGAAIGKNLFVGGNLIVGGTSTTFTAALIGTISTANAALTLVGGTRGSLVYQSTVSTTAFIPIATTGSILMSNGVIPIWTASAAINVAYANSSSNIVGGAQYQVPYQSSTGSTTFSANFTYNNATLSIKNSTPSTDTSTGALVVSGGVGIGGDVFIAGGLQVNGTATWVNSTNLSIVDKNIVIAQGSINSAAANGAGFTVDVPTNKPQIYYASSDDSWNFNKATNFTAGIAAVSTVTGTLRVSGGAGIGGDLFAGSLRGPLTGTVGAGTKNSGAFTTLVATSAQASTSTLTGALTVAGGVGIVGDLYVGGNIVGNIVNAQYATTATTAGFANTASLAYTALTTNVATLATNIAGGLPARIPYQTATSSTVFSANLTFDGTTLQTSKLSISQTDGSTLPLFSTGVTLVNSGNNQSPVLRLTGNSSGFAMVSSFGTLRIMQDATTLTNTLLSISSTLVGITPTTVSTNTTNGALVVAGGVGVGGSLNVGSNSTFNGHVLPTTDITYDLGSSTARWRSLYVSSSTIYLGANAMSVSEAGNITVNGALVAAPDTVTYGERAGGMASTEWTNGFLTCRGVNAEASAVIQALTNGKKITGRNGTNSWVFTVVTATSVVTSYDPTLLDWTITVQSGVAATQYLYYLDFPIPVPASSSSPGVVGQIAYNAVYIYMCVAPNTWRRWAASTF